MRTSFWLAILLLAAAPAAAQERQEAPWQGPRDPGPMVGELDRLVDEGERDRAADPRYLKKLRKLVGRYSWHWSKLALSDDFKDGDFTKNPTWTVAAGEFWVDWNKTLRSRVTEPVTRPAPMPQAVPRPWQQPQPQQQTAQQSQARQDSTSRIIGSILEQVLGPNSSTGREEGGTARDSGRPQQAAPTPTQTALPSPQPAAPQAVGAELTIERAFSAGFDIRIEFVSHQNKGRLEFSTFIGGPQGEGYRLAYIPGARSKILLIRFSKYDSTVFYDFTYPKSLDDGKRHYLQWLRLANGTTSVNIDGEKVLQGGDATYQRPFDGFTITNLGGDYGIREIEIRGTP